VLTQGYKEGSNGRSCGRVLGDLDWTQGSKEGKV